MNPYDFVRIDWQAAERTDWRRKLIPHNCFTGKSGRLSGIITTETPLFIPEARPITEEPRPTPDSEPKAFIANGRGEAIIPGTSLKGLIRGLIETLGPGCWWLYDGNLSALPPAFHRCQDRDRLCPACRMFGWLEQRSGGAGVALVTGHVGFEDARCAAPRPHPPIYTPVLDAPKPRHKIWYMPNGQVAGRKYYFHAAKITTAPGPKFSRTDQPLNQYIQPIGSGSVFEWTAHFDNLDPDELALLLYALVLEPSMRHKLGYAKPAGLGSVRIELNRLELIDYTARYRNVPQPAPLEGEALGSFLNSTLSRFTDDTASPTLSDLRRIWRWPAQYTIAYPSRDWFSTHPTVPIRETP